MGIFSSPDPKLQRTRNRTLTVPFSQKRKEIFKPTLEEAKTTNVMFFVEKHFVERLADAIKCCEPFHYYTGLLNMSRSTHFALTLIFGAPSVTKTKYFR
jgi:hypothetical protein